MSPGCLLGIDVGGSIVKATAFDPDAGVVVTRGRAVPVQHPRPGHNERDAHEIWRAVSDVVHEVLRSLPPGREVEAVGVTGHGNGLYLVDRRGRPTRPAVMASDTRAEARVRSWIEDGVQRELHPITWNRLWPGQPGPILAWLLDHEPEVLAASSAALQCKDFIRAQLTGLVQTEVTDVSCSGLYDNLHERPSERVLEAFGISELRRLVPEPVPSSVVVGHVTREAAELTGIPAGTPVVAGVVDNVALHLGSGVLDGSALCVAAGTWSVNQLLVPRRAMGDEATGDLPNVFAACSSAVPDTALLIEASPTSASALAWALDHALTGVKHVAAASRTDVFDLALRRVAARPLDMAGPYFVPYLDGSRDNPAARGGWVNVSSWNDEDALLAAVIEGVCMEHRHHIERLPAKGALPLVLSGGATKSAAWSQRFADVTGREVQVSQSQELGAVGVASVAALAVGAVKDLEEGLGVLCQDGVVFHPDPDVVAYCEERYAAYLSIATCLEQLPRREPTRGA